MEEKDKKARRNWYFKNDTNVLSFDISQVLHNHCLILPVIQ